MDGKYDVDLLTKYYAQYFSLSCLATDIGSKFALISLICFLTSQARKQNPKVSCLDVIHKVATPNTNSVDLLKAISIICEDYMINTNEFLLFGFKSSKDIIVKIKEILNTELPFDNPYFNNEEDLPF